MTNEPKKGPYSDFENDFIKKHYAEKGPKWCGEQLGRPAANLQVRAHYMGLTMRDRRGGGFKDKPITKPNGDVINKLTPEEIAAIPRFNGEIADKFVPPMGKAGPWPSILKCKSAMNRIKA